MGYMGRADWTGVLEGGDPRPWVIETAEEAGSAAGFVTATDGKIWPQGSRQVRATYDEAYADALLEVAEAKDRLTELRARLAKPVIEIHYDESQAHGKPWHIYKLARGELVFLGAYGTREQAEFARSVIMPHLQPEHDPAEVEQLIRKLSEIGPD
jgi:hypothetical protein